VAKAAAGPAELRAGALAARRPVELLVGAPEQAAPARRHHLQRFQVQARRPGHRFERPGDSCRVGSAFGTTG